MNDNWKFSGLPYTSPDVEALQARYDALTQRAKDAQDPEDLLEVVRQRDALQQEVALCQSIATIRAFHDVTDEFYQRELQETLPRLETLDTQSLSMAIADSPYAAAVDEAFGPQLRRLLTLDQRLHTGGKGGWVHSLTAIAAPHNGTTFIEANSDFTKLAADLTTAAAKALGLSSLKGVYDFQLDQFGIRKDDNETFSQALDRVLKSDFLSHNDNAFLDLTVDKSLEINKGIEIQPNVYYFSYAGDQTSTDPLTGNHYPTVSVIPSNGMCALMMPGSVNMGKYYDKYTAGGIYIDQSWLPNDGLVNTVSALYPTTTDKNTTECLKRDGTQGWVNYDGYSDIAFQPGIWYVMPVTRADHMQFVGGIANKSIIETHLFYRNLMDDIYSTYHTVQPTETPFPFTDVPESRWSYPYIKELYDAGVVSGTSATTFEPTANVTRAQFVTMLAGLQGADVSAYTSGKFSDVPADAWYAPYVNWAAENGVVYGVSDTAFAPDAEISRQDMAAMLYRYAGQFGIQLGTGNPAITFTDEADIADYALPAVEALQRAGVISGMPDGSFRPRDTATREQACVMLCLL